jgi:hypothetical protein
MREEALAPRPDLSFINQSSLNCYFGADRTGIVPKIAQEQASSKMPAFSLMTRLYQCLSSLAHEDCGDPSILHAMGKFGILALERPILLWDCDPESHILIFMRLSSKAKYLLSVNGYDVHVQAMLIGSVLHADGNPPSIRRPGQLLHLVIGM